MELTKYQALSNDYLVLDLPADLDRVVPLLSRLCDRHRGLGSDGLLAFDPKAMTVRIFNPDRSEAQKSGNGLRITITSVGNVSDGWVQIAAEATEDGAKDKAKLIMSKVEGYDFRLPSNQAEVLGWTITDVTEEQKSG